MAEVSHRLATWVQKCLGRTSKNVLFAAQYFLNDNDYNKIFSYEIVDQLEKKNCATKYFIVNRLIVEFWWFARRDFLIFGRNP